MSEPQIGLIVLFLDIDGVLNCINTPHMMEDLFPIEPYKALLVNRICEATGAVIVLSSSWRLHPESRAAVNAKVFPNPIDITPDERGLTDRGCEIQAWIDRANKSEDPAKRVLKYAILDDNADMHTDQMPNFFKTTWLHGLTDEIAQEVIKHLS